MKPRQIIAGKERDYRVRLIASYAYDFTHIR